MTAHPLRIAVLGLAHDHVWEHLADARAASDVELVAVADSDAALRERCRNSLDLEAHADPQQLLESRAGDWDAVYLFADNATSASLAVVAAAAGLHIMVEKPMAHSLAAAQQMMAAATRHNVRLMVNWPFAWWPQLRQALRLAAGGEIGRVWQVKYRAAHAGPRELGCSEQFCDWLYDAQRNGAGALIDYCSYGCLLAAILLGLPDDVCGASGTWCKDDLAVDDNAVLMMRYARSLALAEASWTQIGTLSSYTPLIYGTQATLMVEPREGGRLLKATAECPAGQAVEWADVPASDRSATAHFAHALRRDQPFLELVRAERAFEAQRILDAGLRSIQENGWTPLA